MAIPELFRRFIDEVLEKRHDERLVPFALLALGFGLVATGGSFARRNAAGRVSLGVEYSLRNRLYSHLQNLSVSFHDGWQSGQLVSRAISDISAVRRFMGHGILWLFILGQMYVFIMFRLLTFDVLLASFTLVFSSVVGMVSYRFARHYRRLSRVAQDQQGDLTTIIEESATGVRVIKSYGRGPQRSGIFAGQASQLMGTNMTRIRHRANFWSVDNALLSFNLILILLIGGLRVASGGLTLGTLVAFITYQTMLVWPVREIGWIIAGSQEAVAAAERVWEILDTEPDIADRPGARELTASRGAISFDNVVFSYPDTDRLILNGLSLEIHPGETLAIVGMTGCGKSTLASLVARFHDPDEGRVLLDGTDVRDLKVFSLRAQTGVAFEEPILFSASVRENLLMGDPNATDEVLWDALCAVQADVFVKQLPWKLDTRVGEQGYSLSGGQRQRLALARAIVGRPRVLVLDNPMSSVDVHTEAAIEAALKSILKDRTAILIAHRPSTLLLANRVALMHDGRIVATGTHHDLLTDVALYREVLASDQPSVPA